MALYTRFIFSGVDGEKGLPGNQGQKGSPGITGKDGTPGSSGFHGNKGRVIEHVHPTLFLDVLIILSSIIDASN